MLIGGHVSSAGGLERAIERAEGMGCETMQIFNQSPRMWRPTRYTDQDFAAFRKRFEKSSVQSIFIHAVYLINCASDDSEIRDKSIQSLSHALSVGDAIGADGVIVHPGSGKRGPLEPSLERIADAVGQALRATKHCRLLLENTAGSGGTIGRSFAELRELLDRTGGESRIGICLDSCHLLCSGHEVRRPAALAEVVDEFDRRLGLERLHCLHLNDSKTGLGSNVDRHANIGEGEFGEPGMRAFLAEPRFEGLPVLIEVPGPDGKGPDKGQIDTAKRLRAKAHAPRRRRGAPSRS